MLNSTEHGISLGYKNNNSKKFKTSFMLNSAELAEEIVACSAELSMKEVSNFCQYFKIYKQNKFNAQLS